MATRCSLVEARLGNHALVFKVNGIKEYNDVLQWPNGNMILLFLHTMKRNVLVLLNAYVKLPATVRLIVSRRLHTQHSRGGRNTTRVSRPIQVIEHTPRQGRGSSTT